MATSAGAPPRTPLAPAPGARWGEIARVLPSALAGVCAVALLVWLAWRSGGYFAADHLLAGSIALGTLALLLVTRRPHYRVASHALVALGALAGYVAWIGVSRGWSSAPAGAHEDFDRGLVYVALFALGLVAAGSGRLARPLVWALFAAIVSVGVGALLSRLQPDLLATPSTGLTPEPYRLAHPIGYWNALGAFTAMGAVLGLGLAADRSSPALARAVAAGGSVALASAMYLSLSRGAWVSLAAGLVALASFVPYRFALLVSGAIVGGASVIAFGLLAGEPALVDDPTAGAGQAAAGADIWPALALLVLAAVAAQAVAAASRVPRAFRPIERGLRRRGARALPWVAGAAVAAGLVFYVVAGEKIEGRTGAVVVDVRDEIDAQWRDFLSSTPPTGQGIERLKSARGTRSDHYRVAIDGFEGSPLRGEGASSYEYRWIRERDSDVRVHDAHSLYLETISELGLVGAVLLLLFLGSIAIAALRARLRPKALSRSQAAAVAAAVTVWAVHAGVDWDWEMPALTGMALVLAATLFPDGRRSAVRG